jgi:hypothetical protein
MTGHTRSGARDRVARRVVHRNSQVKVLTFGGQKLGLFDCAKQNSRQPIPPADDLQAYAALLESACFYAQISPH